MAIHIFRSTDTGAPSLSGEAGKLVNLLDALLVNGYNEQTVTITHDGSGVATVSCSSHGFHAMQTLVISDANEDDFNLTFRPLSVPDANTFTYAVSPGAPSSATGTIKCKVAPLGWSIAYTDTNKRVYRAPAGTNQFYLRVVDDGTGSASYARVIGYESMSDIDTGTGPFPTSLQVSGGAYAHKSSAANSTARPWRMWSNGKFFHLNVAVDGTNWQRLLKFGDFKRLSASDLYNTLLDASASSSHSSQPAGLESLVTSFINTSTGWIGSNNAYAPRSYSGSGSAVYLGAASPVNSSYINSTQYHPYPSPIFGGLLMAPVFVFEGTNGARGIVPGLWATPHNLYNGSGAPSAGDTFSGEIGSDLEGREFEVLKPGWNGQVPVFETSDSWDA